MVDTAAQQGKNEGAVSRVRFVNGMLASATTLGILATGIYTINFTVRSVAARRLMENPNDLNAQALLLGF